MARQVLFQIRPALFDLQQQGVSKIPSNSCKSSAGAAARILRPAFRVVVVNSHLRYGISDLYFLQEKKKKPTPKPTSISWGHYHMSGKPAKQSDPTVYFSCFSEGKLKGLQPSATIAQHQLFFRAVLQVIRLASPKGPTSIPLLGTQCARGASPTYAELFFSSFSSSPLQMLFCISAFHFSFHFPCSWTAWLDCTN